MTGNAIREALEPCPFCGGAARMRRKSGTKGLTPGTRSRFYREHVHCERCGASGPEGKSPNASTRQWNRTACRARTAYDAIGSGVKARDEAETFVRNYLLERDDACGFLHHDDSDAGEERKESAREIVAALSPHTSAGAGPVGEAVAIHTYAQEYEFRCDDGGGYTPTEAERAMIEDAITGFLSKIARPVEEPGEVERLVEETGSSSMDDLRDMALVGHSLMEVIGIATADGPYKDWAPAENPTEIVIDLINDLEEAITRAERAEQFQRANGTARQTAEAALAETREHLEKLLAAAGKARTALAGFTSADDAAFELDVAIGDIAERTRRAALTGDAQEGV